MPSDRAPEVFHYLAKASTGDQRVDDWQERDALDPAGPAAAGCNWSPLPPPERVPIWQLSRRRPLPCLTSCRWRRAMSALEAARAAICAWLDDGAAP